MGRQIDLPQGSDEWIEFRRWRVGASQVASILGISPWQTKLQLFEAKILGEKNSPNKAMIRGSSLEAKARDWYNDKYGKYGLKVKPAVFVDNIYDWFLCSLDGWVSEGEIKKAIEIKCPGREAHLMALDGQIPAYYMPQLQAQMFICELKEMEYISFDGTDGVIIPVKRDDYMIAHIVTECALFHSDLMSFKAPDPSDKDIIVIKDTRACELARDYSRLKSTIENLTDEMDFKRMQLIQESRHKRCKIGDLMLSKVMRKGNVNYTKIPELKGLDLDKYRGDPIISWRIS